MKNFHLIAESCKLIGYISFIIGVAISVAITYGYNVAHGHVDISNHAVVNKTGYGNICIFFDEMPARYLNLFFINVMCAFWVAYTFLTGYGYYCDHHKEGDCILENRCAYLFMQGSIIVQAIFFALFPQIFTIHPKDNFVLHLLPFHFLVWGLAIDAIRTCAYGVIGSTAHGQEHRW